MNKFSALLSLAILFPYCVHAQGYCKPSLPLTFQSKYFLLKDPTGGNISRVNVTKTVNALISNGFFMNSKPRMIVSGCDRTFNDCEGYGPNTYYITPLGRNLTEQELNRKVNISDTVKEGLDNLTLFPDINGVPADTGSRDVMWNPNGSYYSPPRNGAGGIDRVPCSRPFEDTISIGHLSNKLLIIWTRSFINVRPFPDSHVF